MHTDRVARVRAGFGRAALEQQLSQLAAVEFGPAAAAVVERLVEQGVVLIKHARGLCARVHEAQESVVQVRFAQRLLAGVFVDVELAALAARPGRGIQLVDGRGGAIDVQHPGEGEDKQTGANDGDTDVAGLLLEAGADARTAS